MDKPAGIINALRMYKSGNYSTHSVCVCVCIDFISTLYDKVSIPALFSLLFLVFQLAEFDISLSIKRYRSFHAHSVVPD